MQSVKKQYGKEIEDLHETWKGNIGEFDFVIRGYKISGTLKVKAKSVELEGELPWALKLLKNNLIKKKKS